MNRTISLVNRRVAVVCQLVSYPLLFLLATRAGILPSLASLLALAGFGGISAYLYYQTGLWQFGNAPDEQVDERQLQIRNQAYRFAYMGVSLLVTLLLGYLMMADALQLPVPHGYDQANALFWAVFTVVLVLPSAILAWNEPAI